MASGDCNKEVPVDLYATLGIEKNATKAEIQNAFRSYSKMFHPDKHTNAGDRESATGLFTKIKLAYDILSDDNKRRAYDLFGLEALKKMDMELSTRQKSSLELLADIERIRRREAENELYNLTLPSSDYILSLDCTELFDDYLKIPVDERDSEMTFPILPEINLVKLTQSVQLAVSEESNLYLATSLNTYNGRGSHDLRLTWVQRFLSPTWRPFVLSSSLILFKGNGSSLRSSVKYNYSDSLKVTVGIAGKYFHSRSLFLPGAFTKVDVNLSKNLLGSMKYNWNLENGLTSSLIWNKSPNTLSRFDLHLSDEDVNVDVMLITKPLLWWNEDDSSGLIGQVGVGIGIEDGPNVSCGFKQQITEHTVVEGMLTIAMLSGIKVTFSLSRGVQHFQIPIRLSHSVDPIAITYGVLVPLASYYCLRRLIYDPWKARVAQRNLKLKRLELSSHRKACRVEAYKAQQLMRRNYEIACENERGKNGLLIITATYGYETEIKIDDDDDEENSEYFIDVTIPLQLLVKDSCLKLSGGEKAVQRAQLPGFYDPCPEREEVKRLIIFYQLNSIKYRTVVWDSDPLYIPSSQHEIVADEL